MIAHKKANAAFNATAFSGASIQLGKIVVLSPKQEASRAKLEVMSDFELMALAEKPAGAFAPPDESVMAKHVLEFRIASRRDAREEETLSIAKDANEIARSQAAAAWRAARYAMYSAAIAATAALVASKDEIFKLISR